MRKVVDTSTKHTHRCCAKEGEGGRREEQEQFLLLNHACQPLVFIFANWQVPDPKVSKHSKETSLTMNTVSFLRFNRGTAQLWNSPFQNESPKNPATCGDPWVFGSSVPTPPCSSGPATEAATKTRNDSKRSQVSWWRPSG